MPLQPSHSVRLVLRRLMPVLATILACGAQVVHAQEIRLIRLKPDPYGAPRPAPDETDVPIATSFFFLVGFQEKDADDATVRDSISVRIAPAGGQAVEVLKTGRQFADGYTGKMSVSRKRGTALAVYIDGPANLKPLTTYAVSVMARSRKGSVLSDKNGSWRFTTGQGAQTHTVTHRLDLSKPSVRWNGGFFIGFCKPSFCTSASNRIPGYELMDQVRKQSPKAWSLQRDFSPTGFERRPRFLSGNPPNVIREQETRRIVAIQKDKDRMLLRVEDFLGHEQYGIASNRPIREDYHIGDTVLIADGVHSAKTKVMGIAHDVSDNRSLWVSELEEPPDAWQLAYTATPPANENPDAPGLFPPGGCYLLKFRPAGTPRYYWGRLDKEWDIAHRFGRRLVVNFTDAPGDLSVDGRNWMYPKDYAEYHAVVRAYTTHLIDRYGADCLDFVWSVFNEPDLSIAFWRSRDWTELQKFYDYTVDGIFRAFEDHGYDSNRVTVGGLEIGAIFGAHIENPILGLFLAHCSPTARRDGALEKNAAVADSRLDGKRSERVEKLCQTSDGKGTPCDFISVHSYNTSAVMAAKLIRAKELALEIDPAYYADLWIDSFESCPDWAPPADVAAADSYLGNGYFPTWCADVARRQLERAAGDARYGFGESLLTFWPWPNQNFGGYNAATRVVAIDTDGDGRPDRHDTLAMPILHFLGLLSRMGNAYWVLPAENVGSNVVSGFASREHNSLYVLIYAHNTRDVQSRSEDTFHITLDLQAVPWRNVRVREYRFDQRNNSYFVLGRELRDHPTSSPNAHRLDPKETENLVAQLMSPDRATQMAAIRKAASLPVVPAEIVTAAARLYEQTNDAAVRKALAEAAQKVAIRKTCYTPEQVARIRELANLTVTKESDHPVDSDSVLKLRLSVAANGANFLVIERRTSL